MTALTREKTHAIISSLARGRSVAMTAERCHVGAGVVQMLRDHYGPDLPKLEAAAASLAKPAPPASPDAPESPEEPHEDPRKARTRARLESARELLAQREAPEVIAQRLATTTAALDQAFRRAGDDNYRPFAAARSAPTRPTPTTPTPKPSIAGITAAIDAHMDGVTDPRILKLHERATAALAALVDALDGHRKAAKVNAEIADLEARLAKARDERTKITGRSTGHTALAPGEAKAVRAWAAANNVEVNQTGRPRTAVVDAWRAAGSPTAP